MPEHTFLSVDRVPRWTDAILAWAHFYGEAAGIDFTAGSVADLPNVHGLCVRLRQLGLGTFRYFRSSGVRGEVQRRCMTDRLARGSPADRGRRRRIGSAETGQILCKQMRTFLLLATLDMERSGCDDQIRRVAWEGGIGKPMQRQHGRAGGGRRVPGE